MLTARGAKFLDAPVSGGRERAEDGTLTIFVGGDELAFDAALPLLRACGTTIRLCGPSGAGTVMKLANQVLVIIHTAATAEAAVFACKLGADPRVLLEMIAPSFGGSVMFSRHMPRIIARDFGHPGPLRILAKDSALVRSVAESADVPLLLASTVDGLLTETIARGMGEEDFSALVKLYEERAGVIVQTPPEA
jgi:3-hydroxyisobutyrate dehydrogenase-like beta-hydroxyacid dehydrogenase